MNCGSDKISKASTLHAHTDCSTNLDSLLPQRFPESNFNGDLSKWDTSKVSTLYKVSLMDGVDGDSMRK